MNEADILEARRAYYREWKAKNKDKVRESNKRYWAKYAARKAAMNAQQQGVKPDGTSSDSDYDNGNREETANAYRSAT